MLEIEMESSPLDRIYSTSLFDLMREEALRQIEMGTEIVAVILDTEGLFSDDPSYPGITRLWLEELRTTLHIEIEKLKANEATIAVIGTVKAGKSTVISAIVGSEVVPSRDQPMTSFPTRVVHTPGMVEPQLAFPLADGFRALAVAIGRIDREHREAGYEPMEWFEGQPQVAELKQLLTEIREKRLSFQATAEGQEAIQQLLVRVNDLTRLGALLKADLTLATPKHLAYDQVPTIRVEFEHLARGETKSTGKIALVDTPGPNEHGNNARLVEIVKRQLEEASGLILVIDYQGFGAIAASDVEAMFKVLPRGQAERLFVFMNKYDQRGVRGLSEEDVRGTVVKRMDEIWENQIPLALRNRIFPTAARYALRANQVRRTLRLAEALDLDRDEWAPEFLNRAFGEMWEDEPEIVKDKARLLSAAERVWRNSLFEAPLEQVVAESARNASMMLVLSALAKLQERTSPLFEMFGIRESAFQRSVDELQRLIDDLRDDIRELEASMLEASDILNQLRDEIGPQIVEGVSEISEDLSSIVNGYLATGVVPKPPRRAKRFGRVVTLLKSRLGRLNPFGNREAEEDHHVEGGELIPFDEVSEPRTPVWYLVSHPKSGEKVLRVDSQSEAIDTSNEIFDKISEIIDSGLDGLRESLVSQMNMVTSGTRGAIAEVFSRKWDQIDDRLREILGVSLDPPPLEMEVCVEFEDEQRSQGMFEQSRIEYAMRDVSDKEIVRFFGDLFSEFRTQPLNWGREAYSYTVTDYYVDVAKIKEQANQRLGAITERLKIAIDASLDQLHERMLDYGRRVKGKVEATNQCLLEEMRQRSDKADIYAARRDKVARLALQARDLVAEAASLKRIVMERQGE